MIAWESEIEDRKHQILICQCRVFHYYGHRFNLY